MNESINKKISVIGLGKLGAPLAAVMANTGFEVIGLDLNSMSVDAINNAKAPVKEPRLQNFIDNSRQRLSATLSYQDAITKTDVTFVIVPTPSQKDGKFSNDYVVAAMHSIGEVLASKKTDHLVVVSSTVLPGSMDGVIKDTLESSSGRTVGSSSLGLCYNPEFIALGSVINNMLKPDITLIGESDPSAGNLLEAIHQNVCENTPAVHRMNFVNAELTKISINTFVTTKISYANMLAELCDHLPGSDVNVVTNAVGSDTRIGKKYMQGAIGYGGPCFPRDNRAFAALGEELGVRCDVAIATDRVNDRQIDRMFNYVSRLSQPSANVCVLGLSYKVDTSEIEQSQGVTLCIKLDEAGFQVTAFDPMATAHAHHALASNVTLSDSISTAIQNATTVIIATPWPAFKTVIEVIAPNTALIDPWRICEKNVSRDDIIYVPMGSNMDT